MRYGLVEAAILVACLAQCHCAGELEGPDSGVRDAWTGEGPPPDAALGDVVLPTKPGSLCASGKCGAKLLCMANVCRSICSSQCGDVAPECAADEGCYWVTSFSPACLPGTADVGGACGDNTGIICKPKHMCVAWGGASAKCMLLCKYGCPSGTSCGDTANGCKVCHP